MRPALSAFHIPPRRKPVRRQAQPDAIRLAYFAALRAIMAKAHAAVTAEMLPLVHRLAPTTDSVGPRLVRDSAEVKETIAKITKAFSRTVSPAKLKPLAEQMAKRTSDFQKAQLTAQMQDALGVAPFIHDARLAEAAAQFTTENVALIKTVPARYFEQVESTVIDGINAGSRASTIAKQMEERYQVSETNAARIANDQVGKFFGALNDTRQRELGITRAVWSTVHDNRVRDSHGDLDGESYELGEGLVDKESGEKVLPGQAINCRCQGVPDLEGIFE